MNLREKSDLELAQILWDYMRIGDPPVKSDVLLALGTIDTTVADAAAEIFLQGYADKLIFSGGLGKATYKVWDETEAKKFANIAIKKGVPQGKILLEERSTNTGDNIRFSKELIEKGLPNTKSILIVCKPYMERRVLAICQKIIPQFDVRITSENITMQDYDSRNDRSWLSVMVGDVQRMKLFAAKGWQAPVEMPDEVWEAHKELARRGYNEYILDGPDDGGKRAAAEAKLHEIL